MIVSAPEIVKNRLPQIHVGDGVEAGAASRLQNGSSKETDQVVAAVEDIGVDFDHGNFRPS